MSHIRHYCRFTNLCNSNRYSKSEKRKAEMKFYGESMVTYKRAHSCSSSLIQLTQTLLNYRFLLVWIRTFHRTSPWITVVTTGTHQGKGQNTLWHCCPYQLPGVDPLWKRTWCVFFCLVNLLASSLQNLYCLEPVRLKFDRFWPNTLINALCYFSVGQWSSV